MKRSLLAAVLMVFCYSFSPSANAQPGVLDQTFGVGGKVVTNLNLITPSPNTAVLQPDGKIITGGYAGYLGRNVFSLARFLPNGKLDSTFGTYGRVVTTIREKAVINSVVLQADGKIVAGGYSSSSFNQNDSVKYTLVRYNTNGSIDNTFGTNGIVLTEFQNGNAFITKLLIRPDGRIIAGGYIDEFIMETEPAAVQYLPNGSLDTTFGIGGKVTIPISYSLDSKATKVNDMALMPDGKAVAAIESVPQGGTDGNNFTMVKLLTNGNNDTTFGNGNEVKTDINNMSSDNASGITVLHDGSIVLCGSYYSSPTNGLALAKYHSNGQLDSTFGNAGKVITSVTPGTIAGTIIATKILEDAAGKLIVAGNNVNLNQGDFSLVIYQPDGSLDSTFGRHGIVNTDFNNSFDNANAVLMQPDGKIILVGFTNDFAAGNGSMIGLARYDRVRDGKYNTITGYVFVDQNRNGIKDANEVFYHNATVTSIGQLAGDTTTVFTFKGSFSIDVDSGTYVTKVINPVPYFTLVPATHTSNFSSYFNTDSILFAMQPIPNQQDAAISIVPLNNVLRPGFPSMHRIAFLNKGTDTISAGTVQMIKSSRINFASATPAPNTVSGDTLTWNYTGLKPNEVRNITVNGNAQAPPAVNIGDTIITSVIVNPVANDLFPSDNSSRLVQIVGGSYDPNDKTENHGGKITTAQVANGDHLQYTIRFQNTGNDTAFNVYIHDTLDNKLDWSTMQVLTSSHNYQMTITDGNKCLFTFSNINLVDSNRNEPGSHGYIVYRIKPKSNLVLGDIIKNTAAIYFDYNLPVLTNTEMTTVVAEVLPLHLVSFSAKKDGKINLLNWSTTNEINVDHFDIERSSNGRDFGKIGSARAGNINYSFTDNNPLKAVNYYRLKMVDKDGKFEYSPIRMLSNNTDGQINIYPNPSRAMVTVNHPVSTITAQLQLTDMTGRILRRTTVATASTQTNMNIKGLPAGKYNLTWNNGLISHTQALVIE